MTIKASHLRQDLYRLLDEVLRTGQPLEIERNGKRLRIVRDEGGDPESLVHLDWSKTWSRGRGS